MADQKVQTLARALDLIELLATSKDGLGVTEIGLKFIEISGLFLKQLELKTEALPYMRKLAELAGQPVSGAKLMKPS